VVEVEEYFRCEVGGTLENVGANAGEAQYPNLIID
jgi:hypothetical protein